MKIQIKKQSQLIKFYDRFKNYYKKNIIVIIISFLVCFILYSDYFYYLSLLYLLLISYIVFVNLHRIKNLLVSYENYENSIKVEIIEKSSLKTYTNSENYISFFFLTTDRSSIYGGQTFKINNVAYYQYEVLGWDLESFLKLNPRMSNKTKKLVKDSLRLRNKLSEKK